MYKEEKMIVAKYYAIDLFFVRLKAYFKMSFEPLYCVITIIYFVSNFLCKKCCESVIAVPK